MTALSVSDVFGELLRRYSADPPEYIEQNDIGRWTEGSIEAEAALYNELGAELARRYNAGELSFDFCDLLINSLWGAMIEGQMRKPQPPFPQLMHEVYLAFDAGEFHRKADKTDDPVLEFTDPLIAKIVAGLNRG